MNEQERGMIDGLFQRLQQAETQAEPRDPEAQALISERMASQPGAAYMLAQVVLVQEQGLQNLQTRVDDLEGQLAERPQGGGFLAGFFGGSGASPQSVETRSTPAATGGGWSNPPVRTAGPAGSPAGARQGMQSGAQGGGFMAGAMQTAVGVAGGMLLANAVSGLFAGEAEAAEPAPAEAAPVPEEPTEEPIDEGGGFFDGFVGDGEDEDF